MRAPKTQEQIEEILKEMGKKAVFSHEIAAEAMTALRRAVIHVHSLYSVLWSFVPAAAQEDCIPDHTPYLRMKLGSVGLIPYEKPGSPALFEAFRERAGKSDGFLLKNHGPVVPGKTIMDAFYCLEELEESAHIAWELRRAGLN